MTIPLGQSYQDKPIIVYKILYDNNKSVYQNFYWPTPTKHGGIGLPPSEVTYEPGPWLEIEGDPVLCQRGFHGWVSKKKAFQDRGHLPFYTASAGRGGPTTRVYEMEIMGKVISDGDKVVATRARLVREVQRYSHFEDYNWDRFVENEPSALAIVEKARGMHLEIKEYGIDPRTGNNYTYEPVVPPFHGRPFVPQDANPKLCKDCGFPDTFHGTLTRRSELAKTLRHFDRWELILYIDQLLAGKDSGVEGYSSS
jgi:hypothetical protein